LTLEENMSVKTKALGNWGEQKAKEYLTQKSIHIIGQNIYTKFGEIDLVGLKEDSIIFFEIKTRKSKRFGYPEVSVNTKKQQRLIEAAQAYLGENEITVQNWRIDVISISIDRNGKAEIQWFENAVSC
jgi:putative endonuclease